MNLLLSVGIPLLTAQAILFAGATSTYNAGTFNWSEVFLSGTTDELAS